MRTRNTSRLAGLWVVGFAAVMLHAAATEAVDANRPAHLRWVVKDIQGHPLPGATIRLVREMPDWPRLPAQTVDLTTDAEGKAAVEQRWLSDDEGITWRATAAVQLKGYVVEHVWLDLFPGAEIERTVTLEPARTTLIRLRGPQGEPLPGVEFSIDYSDGKYTQTLDRDLRFVCTDDRGEYRWVHGKLDGPFRLSVAYEQKFDDVPVATVTLEEAALPLAARRLRGTLLRADGMPAAGWFVAQGTGNTVGGIDRRTILDPRGGGGLGESRRGRGVRDARRELARRGVAGRDALSVPTRSANLAAGAAARDPPPCGGPAHAPRTSRGRTRRARRRIAHRRPQAPDRRERLPRSSRLSAAFGISPRALRRHGNRRHADRGDSAPMRGESTRWRPISATRSTSPPIAPSGALWERTARKAMREARGRGTWRRRRSDSRK